eukprot:snap_masked-scaffold_26-processed-gene-1.35-mRNA-1 protein AED:0.91 eAED:1.00 QI:0/-1/0/1/-1/1/1/0/124
MCDFGLSKFVKDIDGTESSGTLPYSAPEVVNGQLRRPYYALDTYAYGIMLFEMFNPCFGTQMERLKSISCLKKMKSFTRSLQTDSIADSRTAGMMKLLIYQCLKRNPAARPQHTEIVQFLSMHS